MVLACNRNAVLKYFLMFLCMTLFLYDFKVTSVAFYKTVKWPNLKVARNAGKILWKML